MWTKIILRFIQPRMAAYSTSVEALDDTPSITIIRHQEMNIEFNPSLAMKILDSGVSLLSIQTFSGQEVHSNTALTQPLQP